MSSIAKELHRTRPDDETELCIWRVDLASCGAGGAGQASVKQGQVRLRSLACTVTTAVVFRNASACRVKAIWLNYEGDEVSYAVMAPGQTLLFRTYSTHPWIFRDADTSARMMLGTQMAVVASDAQTTVTISEPPRLGWSFATHRFFPDAFRRQVREMLLARCRAAAQGSPQLVDKVVPSSPNRRAAAIRIQATSCGRPSPSLVPRSPSSKLREISSPQRPLPIVKERVPSSCAPAPKPSHSGGSPVQRLLGRLRGRGQRMADMTTGDATTQHEAAVMRLVMRMPTDLLIHTVSLMAPQHQQCVTQQPNGHPDIEPTQLPSDPGTWAPFTRNNSPADAPT